MFNWWQVSKPATNFLIFSHNEDIVIISQVYCSRAHCRLCLNAAAKRVNGNMVPFAAKVVLDTSGLCVLFSLGHTLHSHGALGRACVEQAKGWRYAAYAFFLCAAVP